MTEEQYLLELERLLMGMSVIDRVDILRDVSEYFASGRHEGKSDEVLVRELGSPEAFAAELLDSVEVDSTTDELDRAVPPAIVKSPNVAFENVSIHVQNAHVTVVPSKDGYAYATLEGESDYGVLMDIVEDTLEIRIESERRFGLSDLFSWFGSKTPVLKVELPKHVYQTVHLKNRHGLSAIHRLQAMTIDVESENGRVSLDDVSSERGSARSSNGKVELVNVSGKQWEAHSSNGRVEVKRAQLEQLHVQSSNGRIEMKDVVGAIEARSSNGRIECSLDEILHPLRLKTSNGKIDVHVRQIPTDATIRAKSKNGKLDIFGKRTKERVFGDGTIEVKLTSSNGSIHLT